jgi:hypothetical protein
VNLVYGLLIVVAATAVGVTAMLLVRRRAPEGSYFADGDRASGVFGVLATGFSVLLGFIVFLAFTSYDDSRSGAEAEALAVWQQSEAAQYFPRAVAARLSGELRCYGRSVARQEWAQMEAGVQSDINPWGIALRRTVRTLTPGSATEQSAYDRWLDLTSEREAGRNDRIHGGAGVIPSPLWVVLAFISAVIFVYMLFFADRAEGPVTQAMLMGSVTAVITVLLLLLVFLDRPFREGVGGLRPDAMERSLTIMEKALAQIGTTATGAAVPCDAHGHRR